MARRLMIGLLLTAVTVTGCGGGGEKEEAPASGGEAVAWAGKVCATAKSNLGQATLPQKVSGDPAASKKNVVDFLGAAATRLQTLESALKAQGAPPVANGQGALDTALGKVDAARDSVEAAKVKLAKAKVTDDRSLSVALSASSSGITAFTKYAGGGPAADFKAVPELTDAFAKAPECKA